MRCIWRKSQDSHQCFKKAVEAGTGMYCKLHARMLTQSVKKMLKSKSKAPPKPKGKK